MSAAPLPSPCTAFSQSLSVNSFRWRIRGEHFRMDHVTRNFWGKMRPRDLAKRRPTKPVDFRSLDSLILRRPRSLAVPFGEGGKRKGLRMTSDVWESGYAAYGLPKERWSRSMLFSVFFRGDKFCPVISLVFFFFEAQGIFWGFWFLPPIRFPNSIEHNQTDWVRLSSICSIEFDLFGNRTHWKCGVRFRSIAELNRTQSTDWVRLSSIEFDFGTFDLLCPVFPDVLRLNNIDRDQLSLRRPQAASFNAIQLSLWQI